MSAEKKESIREGMRVRHTLTICSVALLSTMAYGLVEGHVGTAYRHRAQVLPLLLILAAGGWAAKKGLAAAPVDSEIRGSQPAAPVEG